MTQLNKSARARRRAQRARAAAVEAVTARLLGTTTGRMSTAYDEFMSGKTWSLGDTSRMQLSNRSTWAAGNALITNKISGLRAEGFVIDESSDFSNIERRITS